MKKLLALLLAVTMLLPTEALALADSHAKEPPAAVEQARPEQLIGSDFEKIELEDPYGPDELVTAIIELDEPPISVASQGADALRNERIQLKKQQSVERQISTMVLDGQELEISQHYTEVVNGFAAEVPYGKLDEIRTLEDVARVYVAPTFKVAPDMPTRTTVLGGMENGSGYLGEGMVIAIVDSGLELTHPAFAAAPNGPSLDQAAVADALATQNLKAEESYSVQGELTASQVYHGGKVPFAFDYADRDTDVTPGKAGDHGTHVAGIASANSGVTADVVGVAPEAQLLVMKVFSSFGNGLATWDSILTAMDDAVALGADVINLSLGSTCGFADYSWEEGVADTLNRVAAAGVSLSVACGNEYSSAFYNRLGKSHALTQNPDYGTVASPSSYGPSLAVASVEKKASTLSSYLTVGERKVAYNDITEAPNVDIPAAAPAFKSLGTGVELSYVVVPGVGEPADYEGLDVAGKIALVSRGTTSYEAKKHAAKAAGASAILVYNNEPGMSYMQMDTYDLPAAFLSQTDGKALAALPEAERKLTIAPEKAEIDNPASGLMSDFSSWGVTPELTLKPDITAPGGNIKSTVTNGGYGTKSGTSMAAPFVSGSIAVTKQYVEQQHPQNDPKVTCALVDALLMSTAEPVLIDGVPYSPRKQGAGLVSVDNAIASPAYLTVNGDRPKAALGDDVKKSGVYTLSFEVHNWSDAPVSYTLGGTVQTDGTEVTKQLKGQDVRQVTELPHMLDASIGAQTVTVAPGASETVSVTVTLTSADKAYLDQNFENGGYVEGFVTLTPTEGGVTLSLPYMGFYGDWTRASVIDRGYFWNDLKDEANWASQYTNTAAASSLEGTIDTYLGDNPYHRGVPYLADRSAISPNGDDYMDKLDILYTGLLRNVATLNYTIADAANPEKVYYSQDMDHVSKSVYSGAYFRIVPAGVDDYTKITPWDGKDHGISLPNDSKVLVTVSATLPYDKHPVNNECLSWSFPLTIDTEEPSINSVKVREENGKFFVDLTVSDNQYVSNIAFADATGDKLLQSFPVAELQPGMTSQLSFDVTGLGQKLTLIVNDYASNRRETTVLVDGNVDESQVIVPTKTVFTEDFESETFPANGWEVKSQSSKTWYQGSEYGSRMAMCAVSRSEQQNEWLISPVIDLSKQDTNAGMVFDFYANYFWSVEQHDYNLKVKASTNGQDWEDIWQLWDVKNEFGPWEKTQAKVIIPEKFQNASTVQFAIVYEGMDGTEAWVDNVQVYVEDPAMVHTITATAGAGGSISPEGTVKISDQMNRTFTITPNEGYIIADVKVDGKSVGPRETYSFEKVTADHTIEATFSAKEGGDVAILVDADFEDQKMPDGWTVNGINETSPWKAYKYIGHWGAYVSCDTYDPDPAYNQPGNPQNEYLILPAQDLSGRDAATLSFQFSANKRELSRGNMTATVELSTDQGKTWKEIWNGQTCADSLKEGVISNYVGTGDQTVQIPAEYLVDGVQIAFHYQHPARSQDGGPVFVDNVKLLANGGGSAPEPAPQPEPPVSSDLLNEDFEGQKLPDGWTVESTNSVTWKVQKSFQRWLAYCSYDAYEEDPWGGGWSLEKGAEPMGDGLQNERLITPALDLSGKTGTLSFQFTASKRELGLGNMTATVEASADQGKTWTPIWNAKDVVDSLVEGVFNGYLGTGEITVEIPAEFQKDGVQFAFRYQHPKLSADGGPVYVDNVKVTAQGGTTPEPPATEFIISASAGQGGNIDPRGDVTVQKGASQTFTINASANYEINDVLVDGVSVGAVSTYTFENVDKSHTIEALFTKLPEELPTAVHEDFNNGLPQQWLVEGPSASGHYETWKPGTLKELNRTGSMVCTQNFMNSQQNEYLILPEIQMGETAVLSFDWAADHYHLSKGMTELTVEVSLDKGSHWTPLWNAADHIPNLPAEEMPQYLTGSEQLDIPANFCVPGARFAFVFTSYTRGDGAAAIDNVNLAPGGELPAPSLYAITVAEMAHGTVTPSKTVAQEGEVITLTVSPDAGYRLKEGSLIAGDIVVSGSSFTMPGKAVEITALFEQIPVVPEAPVYKDGVYEGQAQGKMAPVKVKVTVTDGAVASVEILSQNETPDFWTKAVAIIDSLIGKKNNADIQAVDTIATATISSTAIKNATLNALAKAVETDSGIFASGDGTEANPWIIHTVKQLTDFAASVNAGESYKGKFLALDADLDLSEVAWVPIGTSDHEKYTGFSGTFDGQNHIVSHVNIGSRENRAAYEALGFFGVIDGGTVRNLNLTVDQYFNAVPSSAAVTEVWMGGLAGILARNGSVDHCTVTTKEQMSISDMSGRNGAVGGLVGKMNTGSVIANCWTNANLSYSSEAFEPRDAAMGGICGLQAKDSLIANSASFGIVPGTVLMGTLRIGGLVGHTSGSIYNCYTTSTTKANVILGNTPDQPPVATTAIGHLVGSSTAEAVLYQCYYNQDAKQFSNVDLAADPAEGKTERRQAVGWDPVTKLKADLTHVTPCTSVQLTSAAFADTMNSGLKAVTITAADAYFGGTRVADAQTSLANGFTSWELQNTMVLPAGTQKLDISVADIAILSDIIAGKNTPLEELGLPSTVSVTLNNGLTTEVPVIWNTEGYAPDVATTYTFIGTLKLPANITNPNHYTARITVIVQENAPTAYTITVADMANGTVEASKSTARAGEIVSLTVKPFAGYQLQIGSLKANGQVIPGTSFTMPAQDVTITAVFEEVSAPPADAVYEDGVYEGQAQGRGGLVKVRVTVTNGAIASIDVLSQSETPDYWTTAQKTLADLLGKSDKESIEAVDTHTGATISSTAIKEAVQNALEKALPSESGIFASGDGTRENPYLIETVSQLTAFAASVNKGEAYKGQYIALNADLDLAELIWVPIGTSAHEKYTGFAGTFDGRNHTVSHITCGTGSNNVSYEAIGFFGVIENGGVVRDLNLQIEKFYNTCTTGADKVYSGGLVGILDRNATVDHCTVSGADQAIVEGSGIDGAVGAIAGKMLSGSVISNCWTDVGLSVGTYNPDPLDISMGGICGQQEKNSLIVNCTSRGSVPGTVMTGVLRVGGLVGKTSGAIYNCYTTSLTKTNVLLGDATTAIGHLVGCSETGAALYQCYYDKNAPQFSNVDLAGEPAEGKPERRQAAGWDAAAQVKTDLSHVTACDRADMVTTAFAQTMNDGLTAKAMAQADAYFAEHQLLNTVSVVEAEGSLLRGYNRWKLSGSIVLPESAAEQLIYVDDVAIQQDLKVPFGTEESQLNLPKTVSVTLSNGTQVDMEVLWTCEGYQPQIPGRYIFTGKLVLPEGILNPNHFGARLVITVQGSETEADQAAAAAVEAKINAIDEVITLASEPTILEARKAYDALTDVQKGLVRNLFVLTDAEAKLAELKKDEPSKPVTPGGGSSHSGGNDSDREVIKNPDGSKTTIETKKDGTVIETTKSPDGTVVEVTRPVTGGEEIKAEISKQAASDAEAAGKPVELPMAPVTAGEKSPVIHVKVPGSKPVQVTIPVRNASAGTVAVIVRPDGTQEVIRKTALSENGVTFPVSGQADIRIVDNSRTFADVPSGFWAEDAITFVTARGIYNGTSATEFTPNSGMTRGMLAKVLHNLENNPAASVPAAFTDLPADFWCADSIAWAAEQGIVGGYADGTFRANQTITREQLVTMLYRYAGAPASGGCLLNYPDASSISGFAADAMCWAVENGILSGTAQGTLNPQGTATRAQVAAILMRFLNR